MKQIILTTMLTGLLFSCAESQKTNKIAIGMSKSEVIQVMGREPDSTAAKGQTEYFTYNLLKNYWERKPGDYSDAFFIRTVKGKVESFGKMGDFDSMQAPEIRQSIDLKIAK